MKKITESRNVIIKFLWKGNIGVVSLLLSCLALMFVFAGGYLGNLIYSGDVPETYLDLLTVCMGLLIGLIGCLQILRGEAPGFYLLEPVKGIWPWVSGLLFIAGGWGMAAYVAFFLIF